MKPAKTHKVVKITRRIMGSPMSKVMKRGTKSECEAYVAACKKSGQAECEADKLHALMPSTYVVAEIARHV